MTVHHVSIPGRLRGRRLLSHRILTLQQLEQRELLAYDLFEPDGMPAQARSIGTNGVPQTHSIDSVGDQDWIRFTINEVSQVIIETRGDTSADTEIRLYSDDDTDRYIELDDNDGQGSYSRIDRDLPPGTYVVRIEEDGNNATIDAYDVSVLSTSLASLADTYENDDTRDNARPLVANAAPQPHTIHHALDEDWQWFEIQVPSKVVVETNGDAGDTVVRLFDQRQSEIGYDDDGGPGSFSRFVAYLDSGRYWVQTTEYRQDARIPAYTTSLTTTPLTDLADAFESDDLRATATPLYYGITEQQRSLHLPTDVDWLRFDIAESSVFTLDVQEASGSSGRVGAAIYPLGSDDAVVSFTTSRIRTILAPGNYYLGLAEYQQDDVVESYVLDTSIAALPDLVANSIEFEHPREVRIGQSIDLAWLASNVGPGATNLDGSYRETWYDAVYLSDDPLLGNDRFLRSVSRSSDNARISGDGYEASTRVQLPHDARFIGQDAFLLVWIDYDDDVVEVNEENNVLAIPIRFTETIELVSPFADTWVDPKDSFEIEWIANVAEGKLGQVSVAIDSDADPSNGVGHRYLTQPIFTQGEGSTESAILPALELPERDDPYFVWLRMETQNGFRYSNTIPIEVRSNTAWSDDAIGDTVGGSGYEVFGMESFVRGSTLSFRVRTNYNPSKPYSGHSTGGGDMLLQIGGVTYGLAVNTHELEQQAGEVVAGNLYRGASFRGGTTVSEVPTFIASYTEEIEGASTVSFEESAGTPWGYIISGTIELEDIDDFDWGDEISISWAMYCGNDTDEVVIIPDRPDDPDDGAHYDVSIRDLTWNDNQTAVKLVYDVGEDDLPGGGEISLYWSSSMQVEGRIGNPMWRESLSTQVGEHGPIDVAVDILNDKPADAEYVLVFADSGKVIDESNETNNVLAIAIDRTTLSGDALLELMARDVAYRDTWNASQGNDPAQSVVVPGPQGSLIDTGYAVSQVFRGGGGFYAVGMTADGMAPILAVRGTEPANASTDLFTDSDPRGIGYGQYLDHRVEVVGWLNQVAEAGHAPIIVGHSLGGALAQFFTAYYTSIGGQVSELVTFNSPGITKTDANLFRPEGIKRVMHYIINGDVVSMAGDTYLPGSYKSVEFRDWNLLNKHLLPVIIDSYNNDVSPRLRPADRVISAAARTDWLSDPFYFHTDLDYLGWLSALYVGARTAMGEDSLGAKIPAWLLFRTTAEEKRQEIGRAIHTIAGLVNPGSHNAVIQLSVPELDLRLSDALDITAKELKAELFNENGERKLRMQGKVRLGSSSDDPATHAKLPSVTVDFAAPNFVEFSHSSGWEMRGKATANSLSLPVVPGVLTLNDLFLEIDNSDNPAPPTQGENIECGVPNELGAPAAPRPQASRIRGGGTVRTAAGVDITVGLGVYDGDINYVGVGLDNLNRPIPGTPMFLQCIAGHVDHLSGADPEPTSFSPQVGVTAGPRITINMPDWAGGSYSGALARLAVQGTMNRQALHGAANFSILAGLAEGSGQGELNWDKGYLHADGKMNLIGGLIQTTAQMRVDSDFNMGMHGVANVRLPSIPWTPLHGQSVGDGHVALQYTHDGNYTNDYIAAWGTLNVPIYGPMTLGFKITFDGDITVITDMEDLGPLPGSPGGTIRGIQPVALPAVPNEFVTGRTFAVTGNPERLLLRATWPTGDAPADVVVVDPQGHRWSTRDLPPGSPIVLLEPMATSNSQAWGVVRPSAGNWSLQAVGGAAHFEAWISATAPSMSIDAVHRRSSQRVDVAFSTTTDVPAAVSFYYSADPNGHNLQFIGNTNSTRGSGTYTWNTDGMEPGRYHLYAIVDDGEHPPVPAMIGNGWAVQVGSHAIHNADLAEDVDGDRIVSLLDIVKLIDWFDTHPAEFAAGALPLPDVPNKMFDVNNDGVISLIDVLKIINYIDRVHAQSNVLFTEPVYLR
ncbi:MAG: dockerin type I domain-containing protein [Pirellulaceae bacterium]